MSNDVKLSKEDIDTLKSLYQINQTLRIVENETKIKSMNEAGNIAAITSLSVVFPVTINIYDLREFTNLINIVDKPVLNFDNDSFITIKSEDGKQKLRYVKGSENLVTSYFEKVLRLPSEEIEIEIDGKKLKAVMEAALSLSLDYIGFKANNGKIYFSAFKRNNGSGEDTNEFSIEVGETDKTYNMFYQKERLKILNGDCKFVISAPSKISRIQNDGTEFWISLDAESVYN